MVPHVEEGRSVTPFSSLLFSVLRLLKEGADPHTLVSSGGSLLHLVRTGTISASAWGHPGENTLQVPTQERNAHLTDDDQEEDVFLINRLLQLLLITVLKFVSNLSSMKLEFLP